MIALLVIGAWLCGGLGCYYSYRLGVQTERRWHERAPWPTDVPTGPKPGELVDTGRREVAARWARSGQ